VMEFLSPWDLLPDITFLSDTTTVTPTFFLEADLLNQTLLDFDLAFNVDLLQVFYDFGLLGSNTFGIGNILDRAIDLFESPNLYSNLFPLGGFDLQIGQSFVIDFLSGSTAPTTRSARSASNAAIPEPGTMFIFIFGLLALYALRRRSEVAVWLISGVRRSAIR
jgi:PEP-CTERM motif